MDSNHEQWVRKAACLAHALATVERIVEVAEAMNEYRFLAESIRDQIAYAETVAPDDLNSSRRIIRGDFTR